LLALYLSGVHCGSSLTPGKNRAYAISTLIYISVKGIEEHVTAYRRKQPAHPRGAVWDI